MMVPFGSLYNTGPNLGDSKRDHNFDNHPYIIYIYMPTWALRDQRQNSECPPSSYPYIDRRSVAALCQHVKKNLVSLQDFVVSQNLGEPETP